MLIDEARDLARTVLVSEQDKLDSFAAAPLPVYSQLQERGLHNWWLGADGLSLADSVEIVSELSYGDAGVAFTSFISILGTTMVSLYGSPELREKFLAPLKDRGGFCATLGSEQAAGSELGKITTQIRRDGGELVLSGEKFFATNAEFADFLVIVGRTEDEYLAVVVPRHTPGVQISKRWEMNGLRASGTYEVRLDNVRVPASHALEGSGLRLLEVGLNASRILIATTAIGIARRVRDLCMEYAETKPLQDAMLVDNAVFAGKVGRMEMQIEVMRNQCLAAAREFDAILAAPTAAEDFFRAGTLRSAVAAKLFCGRTGWDIATEGTEMFGGLGYTTELPIMKLLRDVRYVSIVEGGDAVLHELLFNRFVIPENKRG
ncbi:acyl-CoA dehydrogenase family protein [Pseudonocardiaceae bacterium YIM PH 21723]|nr:acyl-CoA dehydrogenase family protein [Pseudonocardiaceae bacterium YIM PH 21723]